MGNRPRVTMSLAESCPKRTFEFQWIPNPKTLLIIKLEGGAWIVIWVGLSGETRPSSQPASELSKATKAQVMTRSNDPDPSTSTFFLESTHVGSALGQTDLEVEDQSLLRDGSSSNDPPLETMICNDMVLGSLDQELTALSQLIELEWFVVGSYECQPKD